MNSAMRTFFIFTLVLVNSHSLFGMEELRKLTTIVEATNLRTVVTTQKTSKDLPQGAWEDQDRESVCEHIKLWGDPFAKKIDPTSPLPSKPEIVPTQNQPALKTN
jgi:hypothetical protein